MTSTNQQRDPLRILIIGGSGFLSGAIVRTGLSQGHSVSIVTRGERALPIGVEAITVDRRNRTEFARQLAGRSWDLVVDSILFNPEDATQDIEVFSNCTNHFVFISTDFVYEPSSRKNPQSEQDAIYTTDGYGGQKRMAEMILEQASITSLPWTILRPSHIYGPGSLLGCLPLHGRDPNLISHILKGHPLRLVGGGHFLQHPIFAPDLAETILNAYYVPAARGKIMNVAGPDIVESHVFYQILGELLNCNVSIEAVPIIEFLVEHPDKAPFCCDRTYDLSVMKASGIAGPSTSLKEGLRRNLEAFSRP